MKIAVIMGGNSAEREVSLRSGKAVLKALIAEGIDAVAIDGVGSLLQQQLNQFDGVFNILHGEAGENGELAGLLTSLGINYTGCDVNGAVLSWNKDIAKTLVAHVGLNTPKSQLLTCSDNLVIDDKGPWIVKPTKEGSSVGLYYAETNKELKEMVEKALTQVDSILVESFVKGVECTVAIINDTALPVIRIEPKVGMYDYQAKYESNETQYFCPSGFDNEMENAIKQDALLAFKTLGLSGWGRIDFIIDKQGNRWFLEANTTPGMTETSLVPKAAQAIGWNFNYLVKKILATAFKDNTHV